LYDFAPVVDFAVRVLINAIALIVVVKFVPHIKAPTDLWALLAVAAIFGLINTYLKPIVKLLSLPLTFVTFGLIGLIVNTAMLLLAAYVSGLFDLGFEIAGWPAKAFSIETFVWAFVAAVVISIVSTALSLAKRIVPGV
jgi:putative membrane protein